MKQYILLICLGIFLIVLFNNWFLPMLITSGDFWPLFESQYNNYTFLPYIWDPLANNGFGGNILYVMWGYFFISFPFLFWGKILQLPYELVERLSYLFPLLLFILFSSYIWARQFFKNNVYLQLFSFIIFFLNTYILMLLDGGQITVVFSYFLAPFVLLSFIKTIKTKHFRIAIISGLLLSLQIGIDLRIAYVTMIAIFLYFLLNLLGTMLHRVFSSIFYSLIIPLGIGGLLHAFWIVPLIMVGGSPVKDLESAFNTTDAVKFFSFASFENTISLLHPHWPENIFGKVGFMKAEFLILPILAFASLLFVGSKLKNKSLIDKHIIFFTLLGLIGAFLAKGANEPFGFIYLWLFEHVPGFVMFRDPTKFYLLIALSYSILIPFSIFSIFKWLQTKNKFSIKSKIFSISNLFLLFIFCSLLFLIRPVFFGQLDGIFKTTKVPAEYIQLEEQLSSENQFYRTLWIPQKQRFAFYSFDHPSIDANQFFGVTTPEKLDISKSQEQLQMMSVKYIIIPYDSEKEIFLTDRKFDERIPKNIIKKLDTIPWLKKDTQYKNIAVYEVPGYKELFWFVNQAKGVRVNFQRLNPTKFTVEITDMTGKNMLVFSEAYDKNWVLYRNGITISPTDYRGMNNFSGIEEGRYTLEYKPQNYVYLGLLLSGLALCSLLLILYVFKRKTS